ncbi:MAG: bifunctional diaminohydroxyphosphoribosylaminopyrimidine deaminase/5-amino-6-(5-phosphoribosylamino)uracil reductase RibD [Pseudomonadota bacterium]
MKDRPRGGAAKTEIADVSSDMRWMRRALALAQRGRGSTRPNPVVGAVVVRRGRLYGEGFHQRAGGPHAEIEALARLARSPGGAAGATVYVTLEPCCHTGRTAPCTEALVAARVARVVVGVRDPNPLVDGRGIARLRRAGIRVDVGCLEDECRALNLPFFTWIRQRRPLVTLKAAATLDGFIADGRPRRNAAPVWITGPQARAVAHQMRAEHDAVLVGAGTVRDDNPRLTVRLAPRRGRSTAGRRRPPPAQPLRVILDGRLRSPTGARVLAPAGGAPTLVIGARGAAPARATALRAAGAEVLLLPAGPNSRIDLRLVLRALAKRDVQSLLVEGGAEVHAAFIAAGLVDRVAFFQAPRLAGGGVAIAAGAGRAAAKALRLGPVSVERVGQDLLLRADVQGGG